MLNIRIRTPSNQTLQPKQFSLESPAKSLLEYVNQETKIAMDSIQGLFVDYFTDFD